MSNVNLEDILRELRNEKIAEEIVTFMNNFLDETEDEDELLTLIFVWVQVVGVSLASLEGSTEGGWKEFLPIIESNFKAGYDARWKTINGAKE
jgi:hypothetical protein